MLPTDHADFLHWSNTYFEGKKVIIYLVGVVSVFCILLFWGQVVLLPYPSRTRWALIKSLRLARVLQHVGSDNKGIKNKTATLGWSSLLTSGGGQVPAKRAMRKGIGSQWTGSELKARHPGQGDGETTCWRLGAVNVKDNAASEKAVFLRNHIPWEKEPVTIHATYI